MDRTFHYYYANLKLLVVCTYYAVGALTNTPHYIEMSVNGKSLANGTRLVIYFIITAAGDDLLTYQD